jgi:hypothetical protein
VTTFPVFTYVLSMFPRPVAVHVWLFLHLIQRYVTIETVLLKYVRNQTCSEWASDDRILGELPLGLLSNESLLHPPEQSRIELEAETHIFS